MAETSVPQGSAEKPDRASIDPMARLAALECAVEAMGGSAHLERALSRAQRASDREANAARKAMPEQALAADANKAETGKDAEPEKADKPRSHHKKGE